MVNLEFILINIIIIKSRNYSNNKSIESKPRSEKIDVVNVSISGELSYKYGYL